MRRRRALLAGTAALLASGAQAQETASAQKPLFAVEFTTGPRWQADKPPPQQPFFREHSANLRALREQGALVIGARHGDKGLIVLAADSLAQARAMIEQDPSVQNGTFVYQLNPFAVFYGGSVQPPRR